MYHTLDTLKSMKPLFGHPVSKSWLRPCSDSKYLPWECKYIKELLVPYKPRRHLQSEAKGLLDESRTRLKFGDRAFSISAPRLWNALPQHLKDSTLCQAFKKCLKTHLFRLAHSRSLTMTQTMTMCSAFEHFMNGKGAI